MGTLGGNLCYGESASDPPPALLALGGSVRLQGPDGESENSEVSIKCIALRGLFESNPEKAIAFAADMLKPGSTVDPHVKQCALYTLAQSESPQAKAVLVSVVRDANADMKLRKTAIR